MLTLSNIINETCSLHPKDADILYRLVGDWQIIADVSFGDLLLLMRSNKRQWFVAAHARPATASPAYLDDMVGHELQPPFADILTNQLPDNGVTTVEINNKKIDLVPVKKFARTLAVLALVKRPEDDLEIQSVHKSYAFITKVLLEMVGESSFPIPDGTTALGNGGTPRVADGFIHLDAQGKVKYISPNAVSALHRLGATANLLNKTIPNSLALAQAEEVDENQALVLKGIVPWIAELSTKHVNVVFRSIPLKKNNKHIGAAILVRDVTEIRRYEEDIVTKNATIKEVHHRVKNNLQTVSALLRLQARRSDSKEVKQTLTEAGRRVGTIALVHEILSQTVEETVDFDEVLQRLLCMAGDVSTPNQGLKTELVGTFGKIPGSKATTLAIVLNELLTNAFEHGLAKTGDTVTVKVMREGVSLQVEVQDNGAGIDPSRIHKGIGTQIVSTMARNELNGSIEWKTLPKGGTSALVIGRLDNPKR